VWVKGGEGGGEKGGGKGKGRGKVEGKVFVGKLITSHHQKIYLDWWHLYWNWDYMSAVQLGVV
jgi:hypothetical protein